MRIAQMQVRLHLQVLLLGAACMLLCALLRCDLGSPSAVGRAADGDGCLCPHPGRELSQRSLLHGSRDSLLPCRKD